MADYSAYLERISAPGSFERKGKWLSHNFKGLFKAGQRVLEIGPGRGEFISYVGSFGESQIDVVDRDEGVLRYISERFKVRNAWRCSAEELHTLDPKLEIYDRIFLLQVMEHIETQHLQSFLTTLYKHLAPGGMIIITVPNGANPLSIVERYSDITHHNLFSENSLKELVELTGLEGAKCIVQGYRIPPVGFVDVVRIVLQRALHLFLKGLLIVNGGVFFSIYDPNITLIIEKQGAQIGS
ncbi:MAG: class I SAM-dependent methyltransferase [Pseudomonadota bacterium]|jgi:2-polyprenyl-3-methyl-5-hydroxy-6-metoxy-1,4-benzoquinol methylase